ncbi:MAG: hypothetical protein ACREE6_13385 [Limisphaerales bacterium]
MRLKLTGAAFKPVTAVVAAEAEIVAGRDGVASNKCQNINDLSQQSAGRLIDEKMRKIHRFAFRRHFRGQP